VICELGSAVVQRSIQLLLATLLRAACVLSWLISTAFSDDRNLILAAIPLVPAQCRDSPFSMFDLSWISSVQSFANALHKTFCFVDIYTVGLLFVFNGALYELAEDW